MIYLTEDDVVSAVCDYLTEQGFTILKRLTSKEKGDDIVACRNADKGRMELYVEAKGATSGCETTSCYGMPFDKSQMLVHVAGAFYRAAKMNKGGNTGALALPDNKYHRELIEGIFHAINELEIIVIWVDEDRNVSTFPANVFGRPSNVVIDGLGHTGTEQIR